MISKTIGFRGTRHFQIHLFGPSQKNPGFGRPLFFDVAAQKSSKLFQVSSQLHATTRRIQNGAQGAPGDDVAAKTPIIEELCQSVLDDRIIVDIYIYIYIYSLVSIVYITLL